MMQVTKKDYQEHRTQFFAKHDLYSTCSEVHPICERVYQKDIVFDDGSSWTEIRTFASKNIDFIICGKIINFTVDVVKVEYYSSEDNIRRFCYLSYASPIEE